LAWLARQPILWEPGNYFKVWWEPKGFWARLGAIGPEIFQKKKAYSGQKLARERLRLKGARGGTGTGWLVGGGSIILLAKLVKRLLCK